MNAYIWKDSVDEDHFHVGIKFTSGAYSIWFTVYTDAFYDILGADFVKELMQLKSGDPQPIQLSIIIGDKR